MRSSSSESTVSARIIKIAVVAIALGMIMILIALGSSLGLQKEIKNKTIALSGDLRIAPFENNNSTLSIQFFTMQCMMFVGLDPWAYKSTDRLLTL